jgi:hypothetical protein
MEAYVLIQTTVGEAAEVAQERRRIEGVVWAEAVTGPYDVTPGPKPSASTRCGNWWCHASSSSTGSRARSPVR